MKTVRKTEATATDASEKALLIDVGAALSKALWELHAEEQATATAMEGHSELNIDYSQVSMADILHSDSEEEVRPAQPPAPVARRREPTHKSFSDAFGVNEQGSDTPN